LRDFFVRLDWMHGGECPAPIGARWRGGNGALASPPGEPLHIMQAGEPFLPD